MMISGEGSFESNGSVSDAVRLKQTKQYFLNIASETIAEANKISDPDHQLSIETLRQFIAIKGNSAIPYEDIKQNLSDKNFVRHLKDQYESSGAAPDLHVITCPDYIFEIADILISEFRNVYFYNLDRQGEKVGTRGEHSVLFPEMLNENINEDSAIFIATSTEKIIVHYLSLPYISTNQHVMLLSDMQLLAKRFQHGADHFQDFINELNQENGILYLSHSITSTFTPMLEELNVHQKVYWVHELETQSESSYQGVITSSVQVERSCHLGFWEMINLLSHIDNDRVLLNAESYLNPFWDAETSCYTYILSLIILRYINEIKQKRNPNQKTALLLYDAIKPVSKKMDWCNQIEFAYKNMIREADKIILNASISPFGEFLESALQEPVDYISALRHTKLPTHKKERLQGGIHIAVISNFIGEFHEPSRAPARPYIISALEQGFHIHYYTDMNLLKGAIDTFISELTPEARRRFHIHQPILDQEALVTELQVYHLGWVIYNTHIFSDMIHKTDNQFCMDVFDMYGQTSLPTTCLTLGAAGVPILTNRSAAGIIAPFHPDAVIKMEFSEVGYLKKRLDPETLDKAHKAATKNQYTFAIKNSIDRLLKFIKE